MKQISFMHVKPYCSPQLYSLALNWNYNSTFKSHQIHQSSNRLNEEKRTTFQVKQSLLKINSQSIIQHYNLNSQRIHKRNVYEPLDKTMINTAKNKIMREPTCVCIFAPIFPFDKIPWTAILSYLLADDAFNFVFVRHQETVKSRNNKE